MPTYDVTDTRTGKQYTITGDRPPTQDEVLALLASLPGTPAAPPAAQGRASVPAGAWETLKKPAVGLLELLGRPGEFVSGTIAGTAQGGLGEGLRRGAAAAFEGLGQGDFLARLGDSQVQESMGKVLEEQNVLSESPMARAALGFAGDVLLDPLNLLGGAGIARRGAMKGLQTLGASERAAKLASGVALGEAYQRNIAKPLGEAVVRQAAKSETLTKLFPSLPLTQLVGKSGKTAEESSRIVRGLGRANEDLIRLEVNRIYTDIAPEQRDLISRAIVSPTSPQAAAVAANPQLAEAARATSARLKQQYGEDVLRGFMPATKTLKLTPALSASLAKRTDEERTVLQAALQGDVAASAQVAANPALSRLRKALESQYQRRDSVTGEMVQFNDPQTLEFLKRATKTGKTRITPTISTEMPNYLTAYTEGGGVPGLSVFRELKTKLREAKPRLLTFDEAVQKNAPTDAKEILERRLLSSARAKTDTDLIRRWADDFGSVAAAPGTSQVSKAVRDGMPEDLANLLADTYLPTPLVKEIEKVVVRLGDPERMEGWFTRGTKLFKTLATTLNFPTHQVNNFLGNVTNMYASGMDAEKVLPAYAKAALVLKGRSTFSPLTNLRLSGPEADALGDLLTAAQKADVAAGKAITLSSDQLQAAARKYGVIGEFAGEAAEMPRATNIGLTGRPFTGAYNPLNPDAALYRKMREASTRNVEDPAKLALFVDELRKGKGLEDATLRVKDVLFDYAELSDAEKRIRNVIPFYTWTRKNIPLQVATLVERPTKLANQGRLLQLFNELSRQDDVAREIDQRALPEFMQQGETVALPGIQGMGGAPVVGRARLPLFDLNLLSVDPREKMASMVNPLVRIPYELFYTGQRVGDRGRIYEGMGPASPLPRAAAELSPALGRAIGVAQTPRGPQQQNLPRYLLDQLPLPGGALVRSVPYQGEQGGLPFWQELALRAAGVSPTAITPELLQRTAERRLTDQQAERRRQMENRRFQQLLQR